MCGIFSLNFNEMIIIVAGGGHPVGIEEMRFHSLNHQQRIFELAA
jgi:hypothetical protein